jgi:hypothetical protein
MAIRAEAKKSREVSYHMIPVISVTEAKNK